MLFTTTHGRNSSNLGYPLPQKFLTVGLVKISQVNLVVAGGGRTFGSLWPYTPLAAAMQIKEESRNAPGGLRLKQTAVESEDGG